MVPQQSQDGNSTTSQSHIESKEKRDVIAINEQDDISTVFGSQQVKETSNTPYTDATQVGIFNFNNLYFKVNSAHFKRIKGISNR